MNDRRFLNSHDVSFDTYLNLIIHRSQMPSFLAGTDNLYDSFSESYMLLPGTSAKYDSKYLHAGSESFGNEGFPIVEDVSLGDSITTNEVDPKSFSNDSTNNIDVNRANEVFDRMLQDRCSAFVWNLKHCDFEDGFSNLVIDEVKEYLSKNKYVTITWLHSIYSNNLEDANVLAALLRVVAMSVDVSYSDTLLPMVIAGLNAPSSKTQEAALMVIEEWRTKQCLDALKTYLNRSSRLIERYAKVVKTELEEELGDVDKDDFKH